MKALAHALGISSVRAISTLGAVMRIIAARTAVLLALLLGLVACGEELGTKGATVAPLCTTAAITKGPWVTRVDDRHATVLWDSRDAGCVQIGIEPEVGGGGSAIQNVHAHVNDYPDDVPLRVAVAAKHHAWRVTIGDTLQGAAIDRTGNIIDEFEHQVP